MALFICASFSIVLTIVILQVITNLHKFALFVLHMLKAVNKTFELTFTYSVDDRQTFKTLNYVFPFAKWMQEFRYGKGRITGKINLKAESDSRDSVKFNSVEYLVDRNYLPN